MNEQQIRQQIAVKLVQYRTANDLTQKQMAKLLGIHKEAYKKYEQCENAMPLSIAYRFALLAKGKHLLNEQTGGL
jgi:DNA-binding XRE family transcriptional regulator